MEKGCPFKHTTNSALPNDAAHRHLQKCIGERVLDVIDPILNTIQFELPPGPRFIPLNWIINVPKAGYWIFMLSLMIYFGNYSLGAWIYLTLHGSYGILWFVKDLVFPDKTFQTNVTLLSGLGCGIVLVAYLLPGYQMASGIADNNPSIERITVTFVLYLSGLFLTMGSDLQKYYCLKYRPGKLIDYGFFKITRNPNYFGEVLIYNSFAIIVNKWEFWVILAVVYSLLFTSRMALKDSSLRKKAGWKQYDSYMFFPKFSSSGCDNFIIYSLIVAFIYTVYVSGGFVEFAQDVRGIVTGQNSHALCNKLEQSVLWRGKDVIVTFVKPYFESYLK